MAYKTQGNLKIFLVKKRKVRFVCRQNTGVADGNT